MIVLHHQNAVRGIDGQRFEKNLTAVPVHQIQPFSRVQTAGEDKFATSLERGTVTRLGGHDLSG